MLADIKPRRGLLSHSALPVYSLWPRTSNPTASRPTMARLLLPVLLLALALVAGAQEEPEAVPIAYAAPLVVPVG